MNKYTNNKQILQNMNMTWRIPQGERPGVGRTRGGQGAASATTQGEIRTLLVLLHPNSMASHSPALEDRRNDCFQ